MPKLSYLPQPDRPAVANLRRQGVHEELEQAFAAFLSRYSGADFPVRAGTLPDGEDGLGVRLLAPVAGPPENPAESCFEVEVAGRSLARNSFYAAFSRLPAGCPERRREAVGGVMIAGIENRGGADFSELFHHGRRKFAASVRLRFRVDMAESSFTAPADPAAESAAAVVKEKNYAAVGAAALEAAVAQYLAETGIAVGVGCGPDYQTGFTCRVAEQAAPSEPAWKDFVLELHGVDFSRRQLQEQFRVLAGQLPVEGKTVPIPAGSVHFNGLFGGKLRFSEFSFCGRSGIRGVLEIGCRVDVVRSAVESLPAPAPVRLPEIDPLALERGLATYVTEQLNPETGPVFRGGLPVKQDGLAVEFTGLAADAAQRLDNCFFLLLLRGDSRDEVLRQLSLLRRAFPVFGCSFQEIMTVAVEVEELRLERIADQGKFKYQAVVELIVRLPA